MKLDTMEMFQYQFPFITFHINPYLKTRHQLSFWGNKRKYTFGVCMEYVILHMGTGLDDSIF